MDVECIVYYHLLQEVCYRYWPQAGMQQYGEFSVSVMEESMHEGHLERVFSVTDSKVVMGQWIY